MIERHIRVAQDQEEREREGRKSTPAIVDDWATRNDWFERSFANCLFAAMGEEGLIRAVIVGVIAEMREEFKAEIDTLRNEIKQNASLDAKLHELDMRNIEREERRNKAKRGPIGKQGERGAHGERGPIGPPGPAGKPAAPPARIVGWRHSPERYETTPLMSDGTEDNDLRPFHVQCQRETT